MKKKICLLLVLLPLLACTIPSTVASEVVSAVGTESVSSIGTQAAQTVAAELTRVAGLAPDTPASTLTPNPTNTQVFTPSNTPIPCLMVGYNAATIDQTVPDYTVMMPNQAFVKTWRLTNTGSCTWNSSYQLIFDHGDGMGVAAGYAQSLTPGTVAPGQTVDVSVNLQAPAAKAVYSGSWLFRDPGGVVFGIGGTGAWVVKIKVADPDAATLTPVVGLSGTMREGGGPWPDYTVGESNSDITKTVEAFLSYDISGIPAGATITEVKVNFTNYSLENNPFSLGVLHGYVTDYGTSLEPADFVVALPAEASALSWSSTAGLDSLVASNELKAALQSRVGTARLQIRLQYAAASLNGIKDRLTFTNPSLVINYYTVP